MSVCTLYFLNAAETIIYFNNKLRFSTLIYVLICYILVYKVRKAVFKSRLMPSFSYTSRGLQFINSGLDCFQDSAHFKVQLLETEY